MGGVTLAALRARAKEGRDPTCADETLARILAVSGETYLEIGAGEGLTTAAVLIAFPRTHAVAIEKNAARADAARENLARFGVADRVTLYEGDAGEILPTLRGAFDTIFLDAAKVQYRRYFPDLKRLLKSGGTLFSDDILLGERLCSPKRKMLALHLKEYLDLLLEDEDFETHIYDFGEGLAESRKIR